MVQRLRSLILSLYLFCLKQNMYNNVFMSFHFVAKYPYHSDNALRHQLRFFSTVKSVGSLQMGTVLYERRETNKKTTLQSSCDSHWASEIYFRVSESRRSSTVVKTSWNRYLRWGGQAISVLLLLFIALGHGGFTFLKSIMKAAEFHKQDIAEDVHMWKLILWKWWKEEEL